MRKLKLVIMMRDYAFLNEQKAITIWRELATRKEQSKIMSSIISEQVSEQISSEQEVTETVVQRRMVSSL